MILALNYHQAWIPDIVERKFFLINFNSENLYVGGKVQIPFYAKYKFGNAVDISVLLNRFSK